MKRLRIGRIASALLVLTVGFWAYRILVVPRVEPSVSWGQELKFGGEDQLDPTFSELSRVMSPNDWELDRPKIVKTKRGMILFQEFINHEDGRLELTPCTLVLSVGEGERKRSIVIRSQDRATLQFDGAIDPLRAQWGKLIGGTLEGDIRIFSPATPTQPAIEATTKNIQIAPHRIWTAHRVAFRFGSHQGSGRILSVDFEKKRQAKNQKDTILGDAAKLELKQLDHLSFELPARLLALDSGALDSGALDSGALDSGGHEPSVAPSDSTVAAGGGVPEREETVPVEIRCKGPVQYDFNSNRLSFEDRVDLVRSHPQGPSDQLNCHRLTVAFSGKSNRDDTAAQPWRVAEVEATGHPVTLRGPSAQVDVRCERLDYNHVASRLVIESETSSVLHYQARRVEAPRIEYQLNEDPRRMGQLDATGPGTFLTMIEGDDPALVQVGWNGTVRLQQQESLHVLSVTGGITGNITGFGDFSTQQCHVWLEEFAPIVRSGKKQFRARPVRVVAIGNVSVDSPELTARTEHLDASIEYLAVSPPQPPTSLPPTSGSRSGDAVNKPPGARPQATFAAGKVFLRLAQAGKESWINGAELRDKVHLEVVTRTLKNGPLTVDGSSATLEAQNREQYLVTINGDRQRPAKVTAEGMTVEAVSLIVDQLANRIESPGTGVMTMVETTPRTRSLRLAWNGGFDFDGQTATVREGVLATVKRRLDNGDLIHVEVNGELLVARLSRPMNLAKPQVKQAALATLEFQGPVEARNWTIDAAGNQLSHDRTMTNNWHLDHQRGTFHGQGPGWISTVRRADQSPLFPRQSNSRPVKKPTDRLSYVRVHYQKEMTGSQQQRSVQFRDQVRTIYGPVETWTDEVRVQSPEQLGRQDVIIDSDQLTLTQFGPKSHTIEATGTVNIVGQAFSASADRLSYDEAKDQLLLAGEGRNYARLKQHTGLPSGPQQFAARTIKYYPKTSQVTVDDAEGGRFIRGQ